MEIDLSNIGTLIGPGTGQNIIWSIFLYVIFFSALITLFMIPDKNMGPTLLMATVLMAAAVAKISLAQPPREAILQRKEFGMFVINVILFVFPIIAVGMTRARKNRMSAPAIFTALIGGAYFFAFWVFAQSN